MDNLFAFLEGIITFISPCLLPLLPVYISFFTGENKRPIIGATGFVLGFTLVFTAMGAFAGSIGRLLNSHQTEVNIITGIIVVLFGLNFMGIIQIPLLNKVSSPKVQAAGGFGKMVVFGAVFSISWTPCVGAFLGSALMQAGQSGTAISGVIMLLCFSVGLGIPFILSAALIDHMKSAFTAIKKHYKVVTLCSGGFLVLVGVLMASGAMRDIMSYMSRFAA
jgi:cytochrome c-type biogenesis protein